MKQHTLFKISSSSIEIADLHKYLATEHKNTIQEIISVLHRQLGHLRSCYLHPYRVNRVNYLKARFDGESGEFYFTLELSGYTELPEIIGDISRLHINLNDATDAYWFIQYIKHELGKKTIDNKTNEQNEDR